MAAADTYIVGTDEGELRAGPGQSVTWFKASGASTDGKYTLVEEMANQGEGAPLHRHVGDEEAFYVLDGEITYFLGDAPGQLARPGTFVFIPGGATHGFRVDSARARYLILTTAHHGEFYRAITRSVDFPGDEFAEVTGEDIGQACADYGIEFVGDWPGE